ncbi:MAG TPA: hypothetical protein VNS32_28510, partial [Flavisolibacter sp.]|nr:hypothetical protein [Flavisolibacter sp.]
MYKTWILAVCLCVGVGCLGQQNARVAEYEQSYNTYPFSDPDPNPSLTKIYPYFRFDGYTSKAERKQW